MNYYYTKGLAYGWGFWGLFNTFSVAVFFMLGKVDHYLINNLSNMSFVIFLMAVALCIFGWVSPPVFIGYELAHVTPPKVKRLERYYSVWKGIFVGSFAFCALNYAMMLAIELATGWKLL